MGVEDVVGEYWVLLVLEEEGQGKEMVCLMVQYSMKFLSQQNQRKEIPKSKPFNHTITMTFIRSCIFNLYLKEKKKHPNKYNLIHLATVTNEEKTCGRPHE